jgi:hypothetical protein
MLSIEFGGVGIDGGRRLNEESIFGNNPIGRNQN